MNQGLELVGRQIGAYRVDSLIGAGGYSRVYLGVDENVQRKAAIKVLLPGQGDEGYSETVIQRFEREARIVANLRDPHSVQLYEYGQTDDGMLYMIFEFIEGDTLEEVRRRDGSLAALRVVKILEQVLLSLEEAHTMGLVHRDIKPANIMLFEHIGRKDQVKVLDFGVGKAVGPDTTCQDITKAGVLIGTPRYMAPEQWSSDGEISQQTDIYSLGLVIYELLCGERAINATEPVHIMKAHIDDTPIELPEHLDLPSGLRRVVNTMLRKDPSQRYASASEVLQDLTRLKPVGTRSDTLETLEGDLKAQGGTPTAEVVDRAASSQIDTGPGINEGQAASGRNHALVAVLIAAALVGVLAVIYALGGGSSGESDVGAPPAQAAPVPPPASKEQAASPEALVEAGEEPDEPVELDEGAAHDDSEEVAKAGESERGEGGAVAEEMGTEEGGAEEIDAEESSEQESSNEQPAVAAAQDDTPANTRSHAAPKARSNTSKTGATNKRRDTMSGNGSSGNGSSDKGSSDKGSSSGNLILYPADEE